MNTNNTSYWYVGYFDQGQFWSLGEYGLKENAVSKLRELKHGKQVRNSEYCIMESKTTWSRITIHE